MLLYHYSVDSYKGGDKLINDYKNGYGFAEPFLLALHDSREVFRASYYATMYTARELMALKLRKFENFRKDAVEAIFEYVRETQFPEKTSRLGCVYYCKSPEEAIELAKEDCLDEGLFTKDQVVLLEVMVDENRVFEYDQQFYNAAMERIEENDFDEVFLLAKKYYAMERTKEPVIEIVCDSDNKILREIKY